MRANSILSDKNDTEVTDWFVVFSRTPGVYDFSPAAIVAIIKTAEDKISHYPGELRKYIDEGKLTKIIIRDYSPRAATLLPGIGILDGNRDNDTPRACFLLSFA